MASMTLPRVEIEKIQSFYNSARQELLKKAGRSLGYKAAQVGTLLNALITLEIAPFQQRAVEGYMQSKRKTGVYSGTLSFVWVVLGTVAWAVLTWTAGHFINWKGADVTLSQALVIGSWVIGAVGWLLSLIFYSDDIGSGSRKVVDWREYYLGEFPGVIPDHALNTALQIREKVPTAEFRVHQLETTFERKARPLPDPFLEVVLRSTGEKFFIEQWDERDLPKVQL